MSFKDWIQYLLGRIIWYMETPKEQRKEVKQSQKESWSVRWFGLIPLSIKMYVHKQRSRIRGG
ncbi:YqzE family protein [Thermoflavimicrobium daqui]|jgi:hypothetical protein|nr:YqzE family protein [Thermoflavimicrobium daqui]